MPTLENCDFSYTDDSISESHHFKDNIYTLSMEDILENSHLSENFKQRLLKLENANRVHLVLTTNTVPMNGDTLANELLAFVREHTLSFNISLPKPYQNSEQQQQQIDQLTSDFQRQKNITAFQKIDAECSVKTHKNDSTIKRLRPRTHSVSLHIDTDLQSEQTQTQQTATTLEIGLDSQFSRQIEMDAEQILYADLIDKKEFIKLCLGESSLSQEQYLLSQQEAETLAASLFDYQLTLCGEFSGIKILKTPKITLNACRQILRHRSQFQFGMEFNHLGHGFKLDRKHYPPILDYDDSKPDTQKDALAIHCYFAAKPLVLAHQLLQIYAQYAKQTKNSDSIQLWNKFNAADKPYDREASRLFHQYFVLITSLPNKTTTSFDKLFFKEKVFQKKAFDFLLSNFRRIAELFPNTACLIDPDKKVAKKILLKYFPAEFITLAINLCTEVVISLEKPPKTLKKHLLYLLLEKDLESNNVLAQLTHWHSQLLLTTANLNALVQIYQTKGGPGLAKLFSLWEQWHTFKVATSTEEKSLLKILQEICFKKFQTYIPLLDPSYINTIELIKGFYLEKNKGIYWQTLLTQHYVANPEDDLPALANAFKAFTLELQDLELTFNQPSCQLQNIKNLPVALARILALLKNSRPEDRLRQWNCHDQLHFTHDAVMQALCKKSLFIVPEMKAQAENGTISYVNDAKHHSIVQIGQNKASLSKDFFRFIASQGHALSLEFYQLAQQSITYQNFSEELRLSLYRCLAATTTGSTNALFITDTTLALAEWNNLLATIPKIIEQILNKIPTLVRLFVTKFKLELIISQIMDISFNEKGSFPLPIFLKLIESALDTLSAQKTDFTQLEALIDKIVEALEQLTQCVEYFYENIYKGMRFYDDDYYKNGTEATFLFQYRDVVVSILSSHFDTDQKAQLIGLISTFQLTSSDIKPIIDLLEKIKQDEQAIKGAFSLSYLTYLDLYLIKNKIIDEDGSEKKLSCKDFIDFLNFYRNISNAFGWESMQAIRCIKEKLGPYCDINALTLLGKRAISDKLKESIKAQFPDETDRHIITYFLDLIFTEDITASEKQFQIIVRLHQTLKKTERKNFIHCLQQLTKIHCKGEKNEITDILTIIYKRQQLHAFIYFIQQDQRKNRENNPNLIQRLSYYLEISATNNRQTVVLLERLLLFPTEKTDLSTLQTLSRQLEILFSYESGSSTLFEFLNNFINQLETAQKPIINTIAHCTHHLNALASQANDSLENKHTLANLLYYSKETPLKLEKWLAAINQQLTKVEYKTNLLHILSILLSQAIEFEEKDFSTLITVFQEEETTPTSFFIALKSCYQLPPYPPLAQLLCWWNEAKQSNKAGLFQQRYKEFILTPCPREPLNGFHLEFAKQQSKRFKGTTISEEDLLRLETEINSTQGLEPEVLSQGLTAIKNNAHNNQNLSDQDLLKLVVSLAELLYRSKGKPGNSFEINTTQYLTLIAMLRSGGHVSSEIATGEGKSRIMMILAATQALLGQTCDFVTSNMSLAKRDYIEYLPFFKLLGIKTQLIAADSRTTNYQQNAIHFTDMTNLSLFRNKAQAQQQLDKALDPDKDKRCLILDEADRSFFDLAQTRFNYSSSVSKDIQEMEWIYPLLMKFILLPDQEALFYNDIQAHTKNFISFAKAIITVEQSQRLDLLAHTQLETWLESAMEAKKLKFNQHFMLKPDVSISTPQGPQIASMAFALQNNRLSADSKYSAGVHQCLHALLEMQRHKQASISDTALEEVLSQCKTPFYSDIEKRLICSSNSHDFLTNYQDGNLFAVTGTLGCQLERQEASVLYKKQGLGNMRLIEVPRHRPLKRLEKPCRLAANHQRQAILLMEYIQKAYKKNQPVLLISQNEAECTKLQHAIMTLNQKLSPAQHIPTENFQRVSSEHTTEQERQLIGQAGQAGKITFSTSMLGRGVDIVLEENAKEAGLLVLLSYLPDERDYQQILGRSGRYGVYGESRIVISKEAINADYYFNSEDWQQKEWRKRTWKTQFHRLTEFLLGNIYTIYQNKFSFDNNYFDKWFNFVKKAHELYKKIREKIIDFYKIKPIGNDFVTALKTELDQYHRNMNTSYMNELIPDQQIAANETLNNKEKKEHIFKLLETWQEKVLPKPPTRLYSEYDPALDGRAKSYNTLFLETRAVLKGERGLFANSRAAWRSEGIIFADTRACLAGKRPFFANTRSFLGLLNQQTLTQKTLRLL